MYFDCNASTPLDERVLAVMLPFLKIAYGNPSSLHKQGRLARTAIDTAREQVAALVGVSAGQVIFTSGGTEANNLALAQHNPLKPFAISAIEHPSISQPAQIYQSLGQTLSVLAVNAHGVITEQAIDQAITEGVDFVSLMLANNETGVIQPIADYARKFSQHGIRVHSDAVQAVGKIPVDFNALGVDYLSLSSHKIYGPKGCGALIVKSGLNIRPLLYGGGQERGYRAGTENVAAIVGFGKAAKLAQLELYERSKHLLALRQQLEAGLAQIPKVTIFSQQAQRLPNTVQFGIEGIDGEMLVMRLDSKGVALSSGSACASEGGAPSPVLIAMGVEPTTAKTAIRVSLGQNNTEKEIARFLELLKTFA